MMEEDARAARYSDLFAEAHDHGANCAYCPICSAIGVVRNTRPEVLEHLASAAREFIAAAGILLEEAERIVGQPESGPRVRPVGDKVRRIDIS